MFRVDVNRSRERVRRFRRPFEISRTIETVDGLGTRHTRRTRGRMNTTEHETILSILERRARRFRPEMRLVPAEEQMDGRIDETGTLFRTEEVEVSDSLALAARVVEEREIRTVNDEVLELHGTRPPPKPEGVTRLIYENANGIDGRFKNNYDTNSIKRRQFMMNWKLI